jgi:hypothetical protein
LDAAWFRSTTSAHRALALKAARLAGLGAFAAYLIYAVASLG